MLQRTTVPGTSPAQAHARDVSAVLLDVREDDEWAGGHAPDARHVALSRLLPGDLPAASTILCICRSGGRSAMAVAALVEAGVDAVNVVGGMRAWAAAGLPVVRDDGSPGVVG